MNTFSRQKPKGFTLIELMLAISLFAVVSLLTMGGMNNILNTQAFSEKSLSNLRQLQMTFNILGRELSQFSYRAIRDEYGSYLEPISSETGDGVQGLEFTHQGRFEFGEQTRLQRVAYLVENNQLVKKIWTVLDRVEDTKPIKQILISDVKSARFYFYSNYGETEGVWQNTWSQDEKSQLLGIKLVIKAEGFDEVYRIFQLLP